MRGLILGVAVSCLLSGCAWRTQVNRGTISTAKIDFDKAYEVDRSQRLEGTDRAHGIWIVPLGSPEADAAVQKTIDEGNKKNLGRNIVGLTDVEVKFKLLWLYFYSQRWYSISGYPIYEKR